MAKFLLDVPTLEQEMSDCCWHTSAMMIWLYWQQASGRQGPMNTMGPTYEENTGLPPQAFITLAKTVGLKAIPQRNTWYGSNLLVALRDRGPWWCAGYWFGFPHIIVLTGVDGNVIYFNDPDGGEKKTNTVHWFNTKLAKAIKGCIMQKNPDAY